MNRKISSGLLIIFLVSLSFLSVIPSNKFNGSINALQLVMNGVIQTPIFVDDSDSNYNWSKTATENDWCTGSGTWGNPYVIENLTVNGNGTTKYCIEIKNSNAYFVLNNCVTFNTRLSIPNAGIHLENARNGKIINNNCSNSYYGISLCESSNNSIVGNDLLEHSGIAIRLIGCNYTTIRENSMRLNEMGIWVDEESCHNQIENNYLKYRNGINVFGSYNMLVNNTFDRCYPAMYLSGGKYNSILDNYVYGDHASSDGISLNGAQFTSIRDNIVIGEDSFSAHYAGVKLINSHNNTISGNLVKNTHSCGIYFLTNNNDNIILNNTLINCPYGIYAGDSFNLLISNNAITKSTEVGVYIASSERNTIVDNNISLNFNGICLDNSNYSTIEANAINKNENYGVELTNGSRFNWLLNNTVNDNKEGIRVISSNNNTICNNMLNGNMKCIVEINSVGNIYYNNTCENKPDYSDGAIPLLEYSFLLIIGIIVVSIAITVKIKRD